MTRYHLFLTVCLLSVVLGLLGGRWWWLRRRQERMAGRREDTIWSVLLASVLLLSTGGAGIPYLWKERRNQPVTMDDLRILERAEGYLKDESAWNHEDDHECGDDKAKGKWSLYCALAVACTEVSGKYDHTRVALQEARFAVEEASPGRQFEGRLTGYNNLPETRFEDVRGVLQVAKQRVAARLRQSQP